jgi:hypothetical protein
MTEDIALPFSFPAVGRKKITAAFDGGRITSDAGVMLLGQAERRLGLADKLAAVIADPRNPLLITHSLASIFRARILAIACGYEDADDLDHLRKDPAFKIACGRLPDTGNDLCSHPTISRWENAPTLREIVKLGGVLIDLYCASYAAPPKAVTLDIDDTCDVVHGHQQLSLFNAHLRITMSAASCRSIFTTPRSDALSPSFYVRERRRPARKCAIICAGLSAASARTGRRHPHPSRIGTDACPAWLRANELRGQILASRAPCLRPHRSDGTGARYSLRRHQHYNALGRTYPRHAPLRARPDGKSDQIAQVPAGVGPHLLPGAARQSDASLPAYSRLLADARMRDAIPKPHPLAVAEFVTLRERLLKIGARIVETASRIRLAMASACTQAELFRCLAGALQPTGP